MKFYDDIIRKLALLSDLEKAELSGMILRDCDPTELVCIEFVNAAGRDNMSVVKLLLETHDVGQ